MKTVFCCILFLSGIYTTHCQDIPAPVMQKGTWAVGMAAGTRTHVGTWGLTANFFLTNSLNLKLSGGIGFANYNGALASAGPEYCRHIKGRFYLLGGCTYTLAAGTYDVIGDDDSPDHHAFETTGGQFLRGYGGVAIDNKNRNCTFKLEGGYSHTLKQPRYNLYGPAPWSDQQISKFERNLGPGLLVTASFQFSIQELFGRKRD